MTWTKERLQSEYNLADEEVIKTLKVCGLPPEQDEYSDEEISSKFKVVRSYFDSNRTDNYTGAADLFQQEFGETQLILKQSESDPQTKAKKSRHGWKPVNKIAICELLSQALEQTETRISLTEAIKILEACGLPDREQYTQVECDRFLEACVLIKKQGKSKEEVAAHFEVQCEATDIDIETDIDQAAVALDQNGNGVVSEVMRQKAKVDASAAASLYLKHLANEFSSPEFQQAWNQMEEMLKAKVVGKSRMRSQQILGEIQAIPPSLSPSNALPEVSDNGSMSD